MKTAETSPAMADDPTLVFQWERRSHAHWRLASLIALSLLVHAIGFYVLQVSYTPTGSQPPPPVQVMMARPERPDDPPEIRAQSRALAHWLTVTDPSLPTQPTAPDADRQPGGLVQYVPSYKAAPPPFKPLGQPAAGSAAPPRPRPPGPVPIFSPPVGKLITAPSPTSKVLLTGGIASLLPTPLPSIGFTLPAGAKTLNPAVILVGVGSGEGEVYLFREASSGEVNADDFALDYLSRLHFQPTASGSGATTWGWAEFDWGREVYR